MEVDIERATWQVGRRRGMAKVQTWVLQHPWIFDLVRGVLSLLLGLGAFLFRDHIIIILSLGLGLYFIVDGAMDIITSYRAARAREGGQTHFLIGLFSVTVGVATIFLQAVVFLLAFIYIGARTLIYGLIDLWRWFSSLRAQNDPEREVKRNLWLPGLARVLVGVAMLVAAYPLFQVFAFYLAAYFVIDGIVFLVNAANKAGLIHIGRVSSPAELAAVATATSSVGDLSAGGKGLRAVVAVRRNGAMGMGHVGWAFEWPTGWFNAGSVENRLGGAYEPPGKTDFWSVHTQTPLASLYEFGPTYDEFKVFNVPAPHPRDAWKTVVWVSRLHYAVQRRNCADASYDILHTFGVDNILSTTQKVFPNEWYDSLPGESYRIDEQTEIALRPDKVSRLDRLFERIHLRLIHLTIPDHVPSETPPWREGGGRAFYEVDQRLELINKQVADVIVDAVRAIGRALRGGRSAAPAAQDVTPAA
jgi:uncharacterized membrane protein HdeD (DUF308 family)